MSNKVVYIANYRDESGYSIAARNNILALDSVGVDVVPRYVKMIPSSGLVPDRIKTLEKKDLNGVSVVIQHNLPLEFSYKGGVKNIGIFHFETNKINPGWNKYTDLMDSIIVNSRFRFIDSKYRYVPVAIDVTKYGDVPSRLNLDLPKSTVKLYAIGEFNKRKNWPAMILAYLSGFSSKDNVVLIIKTNDSKIKEMIRSMRSSLGIYNYEALYPKIIVIDSFLEQQDILSLHQECDIYVSSSYGEDPNLPCLDAIGYGNTCVIPSSTGFRDLPENLGLYFVDTDRCICLNEENKGFYSSDLLWNHPNTFHLREMMKQAYEDTSSGKVNKTREKRSSFIKKTYNYNTVGEQLKKAIFE